MPSLPLRGAWIEILTHAESSLESSSRSPCGGRGLKFLKRHCECNVCMSLPFRGAWIEILD